MTIATRRYAITCLALALTLPGGPASAAAPQPLEEVRAAARALVEREARGLGENPRAEVGYLDPRLRLARCPEPLRAFLPARGVRAGGTTVGVRCPGPRPWTVYVSARLDAEQRVVVAARALAVGTLVGPADLALVSRRVSSLRGGALRTPDAALGRVVRRPVAAGRVLVPGLLAAPRAVRRGQRVTLVAAGSGIQVRSAGTALQDGAAGEVVRARNLRSRRVVEGVVSARGTIRIRL